MPLVNMLSVSVEDIAGRNASVLVFFPAASTLAQIQAYSNAFAPLLDAVTGAKILSAGVSMSLSLPAGLKADAVADVFVQSGANIGFAADTTIYRHTVRVPAILPTFVDGEAILTTAQDLADFITEYVAGDGTLAPTDKNANNLTALLGAARSFWSK